MDVMRGTITHIRYTLYVTSLSIALSQSLFFYLLNNFLNKFNHFPYFMNSPDYRLISCSIQKKHHVAVIASLLNRKTKNSKAYQNLFRTPKILKFN